MEHGGHKASNWIYEEAVVVLAGQLPPQNRFVRLFVQQRRDPQAFAVDYDGLGWGGDVWTDGNKISAYLNAIDQAEGAARELGLLLMAIPWSETMMNVLAHRLSKRLTFPQTVTGNRWERLREAMQPDAQRLRAERIEAERIRDRVATMRVLAIVGDCRATYNVLMYYDDANPLVQKLAQKVVAQFPFSEKEISSLLKQARQVRGKHWAG